MRKLGRNSPFVISMLAFLLLSVVGVQAEQRSLLSARRLTGVAFLGGSVILLKKGNEYHDEADEFYKSYESATEPEEAERFYDRTTNRDVKSQVSWALAAAFAVSGVRLALFSNDDGKPPGVDAPDRRNFYAEPWMEGGRFGLRLRKNWNPR